MLYSVKHIVQQIEASSAETELIATTKRSVRCTVIGRATVPAMAEITSTAGAIKVAATDRWSAVLYKTNAPHKQRADAGRFFVARLLSRNHLFPRIILNARFEAD